MAVSKPPIHGRHFLRMMREILGLQDVPGIREMRITAAYDDVTIVEIEMLAREPGVDVSVDPIDTQRYIVTVEPAE